MTEFDYAQVLANDCYVDRLCFTLSLNRSFIPGAMGTIASIRKFYSAEEADIIVFLDREQKGFARFCEKHGAELHFFDEIQSWIGPLVYDDPRYAADKTHFYHPDFALLEGLEDHPQPETSGLGTLRHLHPLNVKAYSTGYCLCVRNYKHVIHIDADAFLLGRIDAVYQKHPEPDTVIGFDDGTDALSNLEVLFQVKKPADFSDTAYAFNAGIVFYVNGPNVKQLMRDFMFYIESCYHYTLAGSFADQGVLRALVAKYHLQGNIQFYREDAVNWNPTWFRADDLVFDSEAEKWINQKNGQQQFVWHGAGGEKLWSGKYASPSVNEAWRYVGGTYTDDWQSVIGSLTAEHCEFVVEELVSFFKDKAEQTLDILEIGTQYGRTAIAFCSLLRAEGFDVHIDTCDIFASSHDYPERYATQQEVFINIQDFKMGRFITSHRVGENENLVARFHGTQYDFIYIDGCHEYKQVVADCVVALKLAKHKALIIGDDFQIADVRQGVFSIFSREAVRVEYDQWIVALDQASKRPVSNL